MKPTQQDIIQAVAGLIYDKSVYQTIIQIKKWAKEDGINIADRLAVAEWVVTSGQKQNGINNKPHSKHILSTEELMAIKPRVLITTKPNTIGVKFDQWIASGCTFDFMNDPTHPRGQEKALEAIRGYNKHGAPTADMRNKTMDELSPDRASYFSMLEDRYEEWLADQ